MEIRPATPADAETLTDLHARAWQAAYQGILPDDVLAFPSSERAERVAKRRRWLRAVEPEVRHWLRVDDGGQILAWAATGPCRGEDDLGPTRHELYALYAEPEAIGAGHGRALMAHVVDDLCARGFRELVLWVLEANRRARAFYAEAGFVPDERVAPRSFRDTGAVEVRLRAPLPA